VNITTALLPLVGPDFGAVGGTGDLRKIVGALLTYGLVIAVLMVIACAATWAIGSAQGSWQTAGRAKSGLFVALGGAVLMGGSLAWANWLLLIGASL
jgi:steroid 5-alpha reductase family enzyme